MKLVIDEVNDRKISGKLQDYESEDMTPMLVAHVGSKFLFSTQINLVNSECENIYSFKKLMEKRKGESYHFWKLLPTDIELNLSVLDSEVVVRKEKSVKFKPDASFLDKLKDGYVVSQGGAFKKPVFGDPAKLDKILNLAERKAKVFKKLFGIDLWLSDGNLLGLIRDGKFFPHEKDVDMSYVSTQPTLADFKEEYKYIIRTLKASGEKISFWRKNGTLRKFPMWHDDDDLKLLIDIFPAWLDPKNKKFIGQKKKYFDCVADDFFPLQKREVHGHQFLIPKCPESYLASAYGENWDKVDNLYVGRSRPPEENKALRSMLLSDDEIISVHSMEEDRWLTNPSDEGFLAFKDLKNRIGLNSSSADIMVKVAELFASNNRVDITLPILEKVVEVWPKNITYRKKLDAISKNIRK